MTLTDSEHVAWRVLVDAQAGRVPSQPGEFRTYLDARIAEAGGAWGLIHGLMVASGQTLRNLAERTNQEPSAVAEMLRDAHSLEHMDIEYDEDEGKP